MMKKYHDDVFETIKNEDVVASVKLWSDTLWGSLQSSVPKVAE
jgi:hypothetical protein